MDTGKDEEVRGRTVITPVPSGPTVVVRASSRRPSPDVLREGPLLTEPEGPKEVHVEVRGPTVLPDGIQSD